MLMRPHVTVGTVKATTNGIIVSHPPPACQIDYRLIFFIYYWSVFLLQRKLLILLSNVQLRKIVKFVLVYLAILMLAL